MKKWMLFLSLSLLFASSCTEDTEFYEAVDEQFTEEEVADQSASEEESILTLYQVDGNTIIKIKDYEVEAKFKPFQEDVARHFEMWDFVTRLIPLEARSKITQFEVFHGEDDVQGYVLPPNENDLSEWRFGLAIDIANNLGEIDFQNLFTYVALHEYGHILTLNDQQVVAGKESGCNTYFTGEGCSDEDAYLTRFYNLGWKDIANDPVIDEPEDLYNKYPNRFVTAYAATNPGEDIAEVFSFFVAMEGKSAGDKILDQKINLFYEFPELVTLRENIRKSDAVQGLVAGSWTEMPRFKHFRVYGWKGCKH